MKEEAIEALEQVRDELRPRRTAPAPERDLDAGGRREARPGSRGPTAHRPRRSRSSPSRSSSRAAELPSRVYALLVCAAAPSSRSWRFGAHIRRSGRSARRARPAASDGPPQGLARIEHEAALGVAGSFDLHFRLRPRLRSIAAGLLESRRRISLDDEPEARAPSSATRPGSSSGPTGHHPRTGSAVAFRRRSWSPRVDSLERI